MYIHTCTTHRSFLYVKKSSYTEHLTRYFQIYIQSLCLLIVELNPPILGVLTDDKLFV